MQLFSCALHQTVIPLINNPPPNDGSPIDHHISSTPHHPTMTRTYNRWILTKSCEFSPNGNLRLGQILAKPKDPAYVLQPLGPLPLHEGIEPEITSRTNVSMHDTNELSAQFSAWANLGYVPMQFKATSATTHSHDLQWHFDKLESQIMSPSLAYVQDAMRHGDVELGLKNWKHPFKRHVYMVTGVRIVNGARMVKTDTSSTNNKVVAEGAAPDQLASAGTRAGIATHSSESEGFERATDFVFAYRLNEVRYRGVVTHKPYAEGEVASAEKSAVARAPEVEINDFEVFGAGIGEIDFSDEEDDFEPIEVTGWDGLETYVCKGDDGED